jgi:PTH1 family peptidyl-tRNA hydrolase
MTFTFIGLGNPGAEYEDTRHNTGRILLEHFRVAHEFPEWKADKKSQALISKGKIGSHSVTLVAPETFMNKSGVSAKSFVSSVKGAERMMVVYDDLDLPFGSAKISYNKSSGGHKGIESIIKAVKTEGFPRMRIGIAPTSPAGKIKKPVGDEKVQKHILGEFKPEELKELKKLSKRANEALEIYVTEGRERAMTAFN